jgi:hypothetical protein
MVAVPQVQQQQHNACSTTSIFRRSFSQSVVCESVFNKAQRGQGHLNSQSGPLQR